MALQDWSKLWAKGHITQEMASAWTAAVVQARREKVRDRVGGVKTYIHMMAHVAGRNGGPPRQEQVVGQCVDGGGC